MAAAYRNRVKQIMRRQPGVLLLVGPAKRKSAVYSRSPAASRAWARSSCSSYLTTR